MKNLLITTLCFFTLSTFGQSPKKTAEAENVSISYSAPSKKDREIFGKLVPFGEVWRTGANGATEITLKKDAKIGGVDVKAGTYSLFTIPKAEGNWTVILNPTLKQWGAYKYESIKDKDLTHMSAIVTKTETVVEQLDIKIADGNIVISWDNVSVATPIVF